MLLAFSITAQFIGLFQLEVVVSAIVIEDIASPLYNLLTVLIELCLDIVTFFSEVLP